MLELLQDSNVAAALRQSFWLYPFVNIGHILGIALLFVSVLLIDLKIIGLYAHEYSLKQISRLLKPSLFIGMFMAVFFGLVLYLARAAEYIDSRVFLFKLGLLVFAIFNAAILITSHSWQLALHENKMNWQIKLQAYLSLVAWLGVIVLGRFIAYR